jgi:membrane protein
MKKRLKEFQNILAKKELRILPGNLAYSFFLALIPIISLIFYFTTTLNLPNDILQNFITSTFPKGVSDLLQPVFTNQLTLDSFIPLCLGIIVAMNGCGTIIVTSNTIFRFENSSIIKRTIKSLFLVVIIILLFAFIFIVPLLGRTIIDLIGTVTNLVSKHQVMIDTIYFILQVPVSLIIIFFIIKTIYMIAPDQKLSGKYVNRGAAFTTISWMIVTWGYSYYVNNIASYDAVYGNLANIVMLLFWFYILGYIFVIGLFLNKTRTDAGIELENTMKLEEIRNKIRNKNKK